MVPRFFENEDKMFYRHVFIAIKILCKFGEDIFINESDIKFDVKRDKRAHPCRHTRKEFHKVPTPVFGPRVIKMLLQ